MLTQCPASIRRIAAFEPGVPFGGPFFPPAIPNISCAHDVAVLHQQKRGGPVGTTSHLESQRITTQQRGDRSTACLSRQSPHEPRSLRAPNSASATWRPVASAGATQAATPCSVAVHARTSTTHSPLQYGGRISRGQTKPLARGVRPTRGLHCIPSGGFEHRLACTPSL